MGELTLNEISEITGIRKEIIRGRYYRGWSGDRLLEPLNHVSIIKTEYKGKSRTIKEISKLSGVRENTILTRYGRGVRGDNLGEPLKYKKPKEYIGVRRGFLTIVDIEKRNGDTVAKCKCDCGNMCYRSLSNLIMRNYNSSCGCHLGDWCREHGKSQTREHRIWRKIVERCYNVNCKAYGSYGGRGIVMCDSWHNSFIAFFNDMGESPGPEYSIDRINNDGPYCKDNCRWATIKQQARNKRDTIRVTINGITKPLAEWAEEKGVKYSKAYRAWKAHKDLSFLL